uniref:Uncharacterized protein n=1 Tax=Lotus japonicus TaxID=34305 RepID=I3S0T3_LOTJA|nr:unknown [Lotus japonicus]
MKIPKKKAKDIRSLAIITIIVTTIIIATNIDTTWMRREITHPSSRSNPMGSIWSS